MFYATYFNSLDKLEDTLPQIVLNQSACNDLLIHFK